MPERPASSASEAEALLAIGTALPSTIDNGLARAMRVRLVLFVNGEFTGQRPVI